MRGQPTPILELYAYWHQGLKSTDGLKPHPGDPQAGYYRRKLVKGGPWVPVAIWVVQETDEDGLLVDDERTVCLVDGKPADAEETWSYCCMNPIEEDAYKHRIKYGEWATEWHPTAPEANPRRAIDLNKADPVF